MIAKASKKGKTSNEKKILILIICLLIIIDIILCILINFEILKDIDIGITNYLQEKFINKNNSIPFFIKVVHLFNGISIPYLLITIIFNFFTVYDCFILSIILSIDYLISFCLKLIYSKPPYNYLKDSINNTKAITNLYCGYGWGFPSEECIIMVSLYLSLWKIISKLSMNFNRTQKIIKNILLIFLILLLSIYSFGILLMGYYFFSHLIFSLLTGLIIYFIIFEYNYIELLLNPKKFLLFIKNKFILFIILYLIIFIILSIIYIIERFIKQNSKYEICNAKGHKSFSKSGNNSYIDGCYSLVILYLGNFFPILGIFFDIQFIFNGNESNYLQFNFPKECDEVIETGSHGSFGESIDITQEKLWNKTSLFISLIRLIIVLLFFGICFIPYFLVNLETHNITIILIIKFFLPIFLLFFGLFLFLKPILKLMKLTNYTLDSILDDK